MECTSNLAWQRYKMCAAAYLLCHAAMSPATIQMIHCKSCAGPTWADVLPRRLHGMAAAAQDTEGELYQICSTRNQRVNFPTASTLCGSTTSCSFWLQSVLWRLHVAVVQVTVTLLSARCSNSKSDVHVTSRTFTCCSGGAGRDSSCRCAASGAAGNLQVDGLCDPGSLLGVLRTAKPHTAAQRQPGAG